MRHFSFVFLLLINFVFCYYSAYNSTRFTGDYSSNNSTFNDFCCIFFCLFMLLHAIHSQIRNCFIHIFTCNGFTCFYFRTPHRSDSLCACFIVCNFRCAPIVDCWKKSDKKANESYHSYNYSACASTHCASKND